MIQYGSIIEKNYVMVRICQTENHLHGSIKAIKLIKIISDHCSDEERGPSLLAIKVFTLSEEELGETDIVKHLEANQ